MKRILMSAIAVMALIHTNAQNKTADTGFLPRKLTLEEINLVSSYYQQDGDHAAVTGGIGSQKLTDIANSIDVKFLRYDKKLRKHEFGLEVGIDHYTSASSDKVDLKANSSASHGDTRIYPSVSWSMENSKTGTTFSAGASASTEYDYQSFGGNMGFAKKTKNRMGEFSAKIQVYIDQLKLVTPVELRNTPDPEDYHYGNAGRNTYAGSLSYSQIINDKMQLMVLADLVQQTGYLSLPFHRVYFNDGFVHQENLPDKRFKIPLGLRFNYFAGDRFIFKTFYRFYKDDWGLTAHTASLEIPVKISPFFSVSPFYRYYKQTAIDYFKSYQEHTIADEYYTSNYDLGSFDSHFIGLNLRLMPEKGIFGVKRLNMLELRLGHYIRSNDLTSNIISLNIRFK